MKRAIIFGATGGIGQGICHELAKNGWSLYVHCSQNWEKAVNLCQKLMKKYPNQDFMPTRLDFLASDEVLKEYVNNLLPVNAVVFAHGITDYDFLGSQSLETIQKIIQVNLTTSIKLTRLFENTLMGQEYSRIVFLGSVYGAQGSAMESVYSATKAGLTRFSQAYAREVASTGMTVNVIAPGAVDTPMNAMFSDEVMQEVVNEIPANRLAKSKDIAYWVNTLLNKNSGYATGQTIYVSGGWLI